MSGVIILSKKSKRAKATDIPQCVKKKVFERDNYSCVVCGNTYNIYPNAHFISRAKGGLGVEENIVTLCTNLTDNKCHYKYDNGTSKEREDIEILIENYLKFFYPSWNKEDLMYRKY